MTLIVIKYCSAWSDRTLKTFSRLISLVLLKACCHNTMPYCQAYGCNTHTARIRKSIFKFPNPSKKPELFKQWRDAVCMEKFFDQNYMWSKDDVICQDHFTSECFAEDKLAKMLGYVSKTKRLMPDAVPSIFTYPLKPPKPRKKSQKRQRLAESKEVSTVR